MRVRKATVDYPRRDWSVTPVPASEMQPAIRGLECQHRRPEEAGAEGWFQRWPEANLAIVTRVTSGLVVLDIDRSHGGSESPLPTWRKHTVRC